MYLRVLKKYEEYTAWWKAAVGDEWTQLGEAIHVSYATPFEAGLFAGNQVDDGAGTVDFEYFEVVTREEMATRRMMEGLRLGAPSPLAFPSLAQPPSAWLQWQG